VTGSTVGGRGLHDLGDFSRREGEGELAEVCPGQIELAQVDAVCPLKWRAKQVLII
jgi:hypothetical protein